MKPLIPAILSAFVAFSAHAAEPIVIANFEGDTYGDWKTNGDAFGAGPAHGGLINPWRSNLTKPVTGFMGKGFASSYYLGDGGTGSLTSPEFKIERKYITFLIGGSQDVERVCLNLLVGGKVVSISLSVLLTMVMAAPVRASETERVCWLSDLNLTKVQQSCGSWKPAV